MVVGRIFLGMMALVSIAYGSSCLFLPRLPAGLAGMILPSNGNTAAIVAFTAIYGGLQIAMGLLFGWYVLEHRRAVTGLGVMAALIGGLGIGRAIGLARYGADPYNTTVVVFNLGTATIAAIAWLMAHREG